jgi:Flp pilus assembly protein TadG
MKQFGFSFLRRFLKDQSGQTGIMAVVTITSIVGLAAVSVETGHVYYAYQQLVNSTIAAALAGANAMPNTTNAATNVTLYSSQTGELNANNLLKNVSATPSYLCLTTVTNTFNVPCSTSTGATGGYNALGVTQTADIPLWFGGLIGYNKLSVTAKAEAAMRGGMNSPWNIAIIVDTTASMAQNDGGTQCNLEKIQCALQGVTALLQDLYPCTLGQTCTSTTPTPPAIDSVSLFAFPAMTTTTVSKDYVCTTSNPTIVAYTFPDPPSSLTLPSGDTYQVVGFANNYKTTDTTTALNSAAPISIASGNSGVSGCNGIGAPGGEGTFYAQIIYAAQSALVTQAAAHPGSKNALIIATDGDATACATNAYTTGGACNTKSQLVASAGTLNGTGTSSTNPTGYKAYAYPSALGECGQAVLAAQAAATAGTAVYTIGYGSATSGGCLSDATYSTTVTTNGGSWAPGDQPCAAIAAMASAQVNFYSDDGAGCQATTPSNQAITKLTAIFRAITDNLSSPRLIPNGTT